MSFEFAFLRKLLLHSFPGETFLIRTILTLQAVKVFRITAQVAAKLREKDAKTTRNYSLN
jgi:hypothetical protein